MNFKELVNDIQAVNIRIDLATNTDELIALGRLRDILVQWQQKGI